MSTNRAWQDGSWSGTAPVGLPNGESCVWYTVRRSDSWSNPRPALSSEARCVLIGTAILDLACGESPPAWKWMVGEAAPPTPKDGGP